MKKISRFLVALAVVVSTPLLAQPGANTVLTGMEGVPWGASRAQVEAALGPADSAYTREDGLLLLYKNRVVFGKTATTGVVVHPANGLVSVGYSILHPGGGSCAAFDSVAAAVIRLYAGLASDPRELLVDGVASTDPDRDCQTLGSRTAPVVMMSQKLRDPVGPGSVSVMAVDRKDGGIVFVEVHAETRAGS